MEFYFPDPNPPRRVESRWRWKSKKMTQVLEMKITMAMGRVSGVGLVGLVILMVVPALLNGQNLPGQRTPSRERVHAEFINNIMGGINEARGNWMDGVREDSVDRIMATYASDAMVIPPASEPIYGWDAIRSYWEDNLPRLGTIQTGLGDMDASGQMAMIAGTYSLQKIQGSGSVATETGGLLTVFVQTGRTWLIRAQVFAAPPSGSSPAPVN